MSVDQEVILLDIEGTITSIDFVKDVLFVKARKEVKEFLKENFDSPEIQEIIKELKTEITQDDAQNSLNEPADGPVVSSSASKDDEICFLVQNILTMMDKDRKLKPLKDLQGKIWTSAYEKGEIQGHIYEDVLPALKQWTEEEKRICIYSSGSIAAQKLLLKHSMVGNILTYIEDHFDTTTGVKTEAKSYESIAQKLDVKPSSVLFITDVEAEAEAASSAGMKVLLSVRPGTKPLSDKAKEKFNSVTSFAQLTQTPLKRKSQNDSVSTNKSQKS